MAAEDRSTTTTEIVDVLSRLIHRQVLKLALLIVIAFVAFFVTRAIAANNRDMALRNAEHWYRRGQQQLAAHDVADAIDSFRRARLINRGEQAYALSLARALAIGGDSSGAQNTLLALRQSSPEDVVVNLELARLAAGHKDVDAAVRYYQNALYAPWTAERAERRRDIRKEMIRFLLAHGEDSRAIPELIALRADLPDQLTSHLELAQMFRDAGDQRRALEQFEHGLRLDARNQTALAGAAQLAFELGDYARAARYLDRASRDTAGLKELREVVNWVLYGDPLAPRIAATERKRRLQDALSFATRRLTVCLEGSTGTPATPEQKAHLTEAARFRRLLRPRTLSDATLDAGVALIDRLERSAVSKCPPATPRDRGLLIIGERHKAEQP